MEGVFGVVPSGEKILTLWSTAELGLGVVRQLGGERLIAHGFQLLLDAVIMVTVQAE